MSQAYHALTIFATQNTQTLVDNLISSPELSPNLRGQEQLVASVLESTLPAIFQNLFRMASTRSQRSNARSPELSNREVSPTTMSLDSGLGATVIDSAGDNRSAIDAINPAFTPSFEAERQHTQVAHTEGHIVAADPTLDATMVQEPDAPQASVNTLNIRETGSTSNQHGDPTTPALQPDDFFQTLEPSDSNDYTGYFESREHGLSPTSSLFGADAVPNEMPNNE